jgi:hypothetical protein
MKQKTQLKAITSKYIATPDEGYAIQVCREYILPFRNDFGLDWYIMSTRMGEQGMELTLRAETPVKLDNNKTRIMISITLPILTFTIGVLIGVFIIFLFNKV